MPAAAAQDDEPAVAGEPSASPSFDLDIRAPAPLRALLERHLDLRRYREVSDLDDAEIARLITLAEKEVREHAGTLGYFSPNILITREPGPRPVVVVAVDPGEQTRVADVDMQFQGDIATSTDADAIAQRDDIRAGWRLPP